MHQFFIKLGKLYFGPIFDPFGTKTPIALLALKSQNNIFWKNLVLSIFKLDKTNFM